MRVVCTAGHVDHGKSTLVRALTGMEPDRLAEEQERGLTIDLGFAWADLGDPPRTVAFVDLPGHERFVPNMLAGAGPVELALLVVAADEGWMPQSQEHLDILDLLGVRRGLVALTKTDLVDAETVVVADEMVREQLAATAFADVPIVPVSAVTGAGLDELVAALGRVLDDAPEAADQGSPRLWVDRVFSVRGAGTVVTGTLAGGALAVGDEVVLLPGGRRARIRGLQMLGQEAAAAPPGSRVAVNLVGVDRSDVARGDVVAGPDSFLEAAAFEGSVRTVSGHEVRRRGAWHLHVGAARRLVKVLPLGEGLVRVELDRPAVLAAGDRYVLREAGRRATVAGGTVVDPDPLPRSRAPERLASLAARADALTAGDRARLLELHVLERGAVPAGRARAATGHQGAAEVITIGAWLAHPAPVERWAHEAHRALTDYHRRHPVERSAPKPVAGKALVAAGCPAALAEDLLDWLVAEGRLAGEGPGVRTPEHAVQLDPGQAAARQRLLDLLAADLFAPPGLRAAAADAGADGPLVRELEAAGEIVRVDTDVAFVARALEEASSRLRDAYRAEGPLTAARAKEALGTTRKYALPLLEELDRRGLTRRVGDTREVR
jgi:selenocysteine-specific elongation factor